MIKTYLSSASKSRSLTSQIRDAEQQILSRQRGIGARADTLIKKIHQEMTAPSTLLLTVGIGFIIGELTNSETTNNRGTTTEKQRTIETSPLKTALNLLSVVHTLYTALPIAWMLKSFQKPRGRALAFNRPNDDPNRCGLLPAQPVTAEGQNDSYWLIFWIPENHREGHMVKISSITVVQFFLMYIKSPFPFVNKVIFPQSGRNLNEI